MALVVSAQGIEDTVRSGALVLPIKKEHVAAWYWRKDLVSVGHDRPREPNTP